MRTRGQTRVAAPGQPAGYELTIAMSSATVDALTESAYWLYSFKAIQISDRAAVPLVWLRTQSYSTSTGLGWSDDYQVFTSLQSLPTSAPVAPSASYVISPGQLFEVTSPAGTGGVSSGGTPGAFTIVNQTQTQVTCGVAEAASAGAAPTSAMPLYGNGLQVVTPLPLVLLFFSTAPLALSSPVSRSAGPGILVSFDGASTRAVQFDINAGWSWGDFAWAQSIPSYTDVVPYLCVPPSSARSQGRG